MMNEMRRSVCGIRLQFGLLVHHDMSVFSAERSNLKVSQHRILVDEVAAVLIKCVLIL